MIDEETENEWKKRPKRQLSLMAGLQFDWLGFSTFTTYKRTKIFLFGIIQCGQTGDQSIQ